MPGASVARICRNWRGRHGRRCCECGVNGGNAAGAGEAARATIDGWRVPPQRKEQRGRRRPTPHFLSNDECSEGTIYSCARRTFVKRPILCVACMHRRGQQCPTMPRHVEFSFTVSAPSRRVDSASATHSTLPPESALRRHLYLMHSLRTRTRRVGVG